MRPLLLLGLTGLSVAAETVTTVCSSTLIVTETASASPAPDTSSSNIFTVATDDSGQFTAIGDAISQAQSNGIPTVTVLAGTYPAVTVSATPTVTVLGQTDSENDYSQNQVVISDDGTALTIAADAEGITLKNLNFASTGSAAAVIVRGNKNGFYDCQFISTGTVVAAKLGLAVIANSYIEGSKNIISGAANLYIFNTDIVPTDDTATIVYNQGTTSDDTLYNSTIVLDQSTVSSKEGANIARVFLAAASGPGSVVIYRGSSLRSLIADTGVPLDDTTLDERNFYGEYDNAGSGAYASNADIRLPYVTLLSASGLSPFTVDAVVAEGYPDFATSDISWIEPAVLAAIESADVIAPSSMGSGSTSDTGTGVGSGDGTGSSDGSGSDTGSGSGSGTDDGSGDDTGSGTGTGSGSGDGTDTSSSSGSSGDDTGVGSGSGTGDGSGSDTGPGSGSGTDDGSGGGDGTDPGSGSDTGTGSGSGSGSGFGDGTGSGSTNQSGIGDDFGDALGDEIGDDVGDPAGDIGNGNGDGDGDSSDGSGSATDASGSSTSSTPATPTSTSTPATSTYIVSTDPSKDEYESVTAAFNALPDDGQPYTILVKAGTYKDQITISRKGQVIIRGETSFANDFTKNTVTIEAPDTAATNDDDEVPLSITIRTDDGTQTALYNIDFKNKKTGANTAAFVADFHGQVAAYGCSFIGNANTLFANKGTQIFSNSYIEGSTDFIWGYAMAFFHQCHIAVSMAGGFISAQSRPSADASGGFVIDTSLVTYINYSDEFGKTYLGRPYSTYSLVVYMNSYLDKLINPAGWHIWSDASPRTGHVSFFEYNNSGPGRWSKDRVPFAKELTEAEASDYTISKWVGDTSWLDKDAYDLEPSYDFTGPTPTSGSSTGTSPTTSSASATWAHPSSGTTPPAGAVLVSQSGSSTSVEGSYRNLTDALISLPSDDTTQVIFIYPGSYGEQLPTIDRDGAVMIIGYTEKDPGRGYTENEVTITFSRGLSISPRPSGHTNSETATLSAASAKIALYNINIVNTDNLDGSESSYVTVAAFISGSHIGFYGCSFVGWQETLLTGGKDVYQYYESSYIEGAIDIISGPAKAYFKGCTIGAKKSKSAFTAQSRDSSKSTGGYIFDQCFFGAAFYAPANLAESVYLGRPLFEYALVVVKTSYLADVINPSGWEAWSSDDPRTSQVTFAEYKNTGPGNWENNKKAREDGLGTLLTSDTYSLEDVMDSTDWIDLTYWDEIVTPKETSGSSPAGSDDGSSPTPTSAATSGGTSPPSGAYIVSKKRIPDTTTYKSIQKALDASTSEETSIIFIYPGTYEEQLTISASGVVVFIGYSESTDNFSSNQVTIKHDQGVNIESDELSSDGATVLVTADRFKAINVNFVNSNAGRGSTASVALAAKSSEYVSLHTCQVVGGQRSLLVDGFLFTSNTYIEGGNDMILGGGAGYFLNSTISPSEDEVSLTANKGSSDSAPSGFVFDQSTVKAAAGAGSLSNIALGRPWNSLARVAFVNSYLGSLVKPAGWNQWSFSSPRTSDVLFGEYGNFGPGSDTSDRAPFATQLDNEEVVQFEIANFFQDTSWIDLSIAIATPFKAGEPSSTTTTSPSASTDASSGDSAPTTTTTIVVTDDGTTKTTTTKADKTSTIKSTTTWGGPDAVTRTTTVDSGQTATAAAAVSTETVRPTTTVTKTVPGKGSISTVRSSTTKTIISTEAVSTSTSVTTSWTTSVKTANIKTSKVTSTLTVISGGGATTTQTEKPKTVTSTTTLSCIPPARISRRELQPRVQDASTVTKSSTVKAFAETSTVTVTASIEYITDVITETNTVEAEQTSYLTRTGPASTQTVTASSETSTTTVTSPIVTTKVDTIILTAGFQIPSLVVTSTKTKTAKAVLNLPPVTSTKTKTTTIRQTPTVTITSQENLTTSTTTKTVTGKDATTCAS